MPSPQRPARPATGPAQLSREGPRVFSSKTPPTATVQCTVVSLVHSTAFNSKDFLGVLSGLCG